MQTEREETMAISRGQVAKSVREDKLLHPERYCGVRGCLWKTAMLNPERNGYILYSNPCRKHDMAQPSCREKGQI